MLIMVPRSLGENQCVITRPQGGHPMPLNQPTAALSTPMTKMASALLSAPMNWMGTIMKHMEMAVRMRPSGRNTRALERSDTLPMRNLESA